MFSSGVLLLISYITVLLLLAWPLGIALTRLVDERLPLWLVRFESRIKIVDNSHMNWQTYAAAVLLFNILGAVVLFFMLLFQDLLPLNPQHLPGVSPLLAMNTSISFITNTNWQAYSGETTLSPLSQMLGLTVHNFLSAANGIAVAFVLMRALARTGTQQLGNAWADIWRITVYLLLPLSLVYALFLAQQGVVQTFAAQIDVPGLNGVAQHIPLGPVASQEAIKMLGTNGGGYFNANSAHPFENPTALTNFVQMISILLIPAALCVCFGRVAGDHRLGSSLLWTMGIMLVVAALTIMWAESHGHPVLAQLPVDQQISALQNGGNMEGKETRFGIWASSLFATVTTAASCGAVNAMHDSLTPLGGMVPMILMQLGEVVFGGVGSGWYGMMLFVFLTVFLAGLMIGRTPEYMGKKIEIYEMKMVTIAILIPPALVLLGTALALILPQGLVSLHESGAHGFSEMLYAFSSAANNNGSAFAGLNANTPFMNITLAVMMFIGRFGVMVPVLAVAGSLAEKRHQPSSAGSLACHGPLFVGMLIGVVLLIGALTFIPALALGPVVEHLILWQTH
ncbi:potassium-transporting ATPase subunit KdpA [Tolumonas lignilytica]|jgi:K+-transporting ATPase, KdpA|uniref:potassium-transporting ATPase subunit KdpA n=1 Tax=Tolumonas lignilytica TaxID=1283284 RepID=UPI0004634AEE|nr:potassium-transporting ATPase subunit KdpA [Tolumonas lignilytica]